MNESQLYPPHDERIWPDELFVSAPALGAGKTWDYFSVRFAESFFLQFIVTILGVTVKLILGKAGSIRHYATVVFREPRETGGREIHRNFRNRGDTTVPFLCGGCSSRAHPRTGFDCSAKNSLNC